MSPSYYDLMHAHTSETLRTINSEELFTLGSTQQIINWLVGEFENWVKASLHRSNEELICQSALLLFDLIGKVVSSTPMFIHDKTVLNQKFLEVQKTQVHNISKL